MSTAVAAQIPPWVSRRVEAERATLGPGRVVFILPRTRRYLVLPTIAVPLGYAVGAGAAALLLLSPESRAIGAGVLARWTLLWIFLAKLLAGAWRMHLIATTTGVSIRQYWLGTRIVRWEEVHRIEPLTRGLRQGRAVLVLRTGERQICDATETRFAVHQGYRRSDFRTADGHVAYPAVDELIRIHRAWLAGHR